MYLLCHRMGNYIKKGSIKAALTSYNLPIINAHKFLRQSAGVERHPQQDLGGGRPPAFNISL